MTGSPDGVTGGTALNVADFERVEAVFAEGARLDPAGRARLLDAACFERPDLRTRLETLLAAHDRMAQDAEEEPASAVGTRLGPYQLVERIGEGGMGEVYRAERADGEFTRQVAIKITRTAIGHGDVLRRFRVERQILASLHHPHIVTLLDGGATAEGQAYLAMEYVAGAPITRYCREHTLDLEPRLDLFLAVCSAVQYAHQHAIVHRDLKPANIVVTAEGVAKVLDFGVAKLLEPVQEDASITRSVLPGPLTPNYASPEQLRGLPVTTACDVYALGVLLYELISDTRPYETQRVPFDRVLQIVVQDEPPRPSVAAAPARLPYSSARLRGDLDAIVSKAMAKAPAERYASAGELAGDIKRFLAREPVVARPPSLAYVLRRLASRNKMVVTVTMLALVGIVAAGGVALWQQQAARRAQARAEERFREVRQLTNAVIFKIHDAVMPLAGSTPVRRTIVEEALAYLERLDQESQGDEALRLELAAAYRQIGGILGDPHRPNLGDREGAIRQFRRARDLALPLATAPQPSLEALTAAADANCRLAAVFQRAANMDQAIAHAREALAYGTEAVNRYGDAGRESQAAAVLMLAMTHNSSAEARRLWNEAGTLYESLVASRPHSTTLLRNLALVEKYLGTLMQDQKDHKAADTHYRRALALDEERLAIHSADRQTRLDVAIDFANIANVAEQVGDMTTAADMYQRSWQLRRQLMESDPTDVLAQARAAYVRGRLAYVALRRGDRQAALEHARESVRGHEGVVARTKDAGAGSELGEALVTLGIVERAIGRSSSACARFDKAIELLRRGPIVGRFKENIERATSELSACD